MEQHYKQIIIKEVEFIEKRIKILKEILNNKTLSFVRNYINDDSFKDELSLLSIPLKDIEYSIKMFEYEKCVYEEHLVELISKKEEIKKRISELTETET